jgi:hypothetical protein
MRTHRILSLGCVNHSVDSGLPLAALLVSWPIAWPISSTWPRPSLLAQANPVIEAQQTAP